MRVLHNDALRLRDLGLCMRRSNEDESNKCGYGHDGQLSIEVSKLLMKLIEIVEASNDLRTPQEAHKNQRTVKSDLMYSDNKKIRLSGVRKPCAVL